MGLDFLQSQLEGIVKSCQVLRNSDMMKVDILCKMSNVRKYHLVVLIGVEQLKIVTILSYSPLANFDLVLCPMASGSKFMTLLRFLSLLVFLLVLLPSEVVC